MNYRFLTTETNSNKIVFSEKGKKTHETFHILKMKTLFEKEQHFENENTFQKRTTLWVRLDLHCNLVKRPVEGTTVSMTMFL